MTLFAEPLDAVPTGMAIAGYASLFNVRDLSGDVVRPGAFAASLARRGASGVRMLFQHDGAEPIGAWDVVAEDRRGLFVQGRILEAGGKSRAARRLVAAGAVDGLSIGFRTVRERRSGSLRDLVEIDLWEVSVVTFPMLPDARLTVVSAPSSRPIQPAYGRNA